MSVDDVATTCHRCGQRRASEQIHSRNFTGVEAIADGSGDWECMGWLCGDCGLHPGNLADFARVVRQRRPDAGFFRTTSLPDGTRTRLPYHIPTA